MTTHEAIHQDLRFLVMRSKDGQAPSTYTRFDTREEAEAVAKSLQLGCYDHRLKFSVMEMPEGWGLPIPSGDR